MEMDREGSGPGHLALKGEMTIQHAASLKTMLLKAAEDGGLALDCSSVTEIDVAGLQLLCSAHRTFTKWGKGFSLAGEKPAPFKQTVRESGYAREKGCSLDRDGSCVWVMGGSDE